MTKLLKIWLLLVVFPFTLYGCGDTNHFEDLQNQILILQKHVQSGKELTLSNLKPPTPVQYDSRKTLRSPFDMPINPQTMSINPLENVPLTSLQYTGELSENNKTVAFVVGADGKTYQVAVGDPIGDHSGKVVGIYADRIEVFEMDSDEVNTTQRITTIPLKEGR